MHYYQAADASRTGAALKLSINSNYCNKGIIQIICCLKNYCKVNTYRTFEEFSICQITLFYEAMQFFTLKSLNFIQNSIHVLVLKIHLCFWRARLCSKMSVGVPMSIFSFTIVLGFSSIFLGKKCTIITDSRHFFRSQSKKLDFFFIFTHKNTGN